MSADKPKWRRVLLKVSGEAFASESSDETIDGEIDRTGGDEGLPVLPDLDPHPVTGDAVQGAGRLSM